MERMLRDIIASQLKLKVKSLALDKKEGMNYSGMADTEEKVKLAVSAEWDGTQYNLRAVPIGQ